MAKEIPILFSTAMVQAILEGRKTMTRRTAGLKEINKSPDDWIISKPITCNPERLVYEFTNKTTGATIRIKSPYGYKGDILWVREMLEQQGELGLWYVADNEGIDDDIIPQDYPSYRNYAHCNIPSIHMPKWASRIWPEVTSVRVERLHGITEADAKAEGGAWTDNGPVDWAQGKTFEEVNPIAGWKRGWSHSGETDPDKCLLTARSSFGNLWEKINGRESWDANPWVWVVEFKVLSTTGKPNSIPQPNGAIATETK